jgi:hypothetical protein
MPYAFTQEVPADATIYGEIRSKLGVEPPTGLVAHIVVKHDGGLRYIDVWDTQADWERFRQDHVEPTVTEVLSSHGIPHDHSLVTTTEMEVIDTWLGAAGAR